MKKKELIKKINIPINGIKEAVCRCFSKNLIREIDRVEVYFPKWSNEDTQIDVYFKHRSGFKRYYLDYNFRFNKYTIVEWEWH